MRTLVVAPNYPWPATGGGRIRLAITLGGLARLGPVDLFSVVEPTRPDAIEEPDDLPVERYQVVTRPPASRSVLRRAAWLGFGSRPEEVALRAYDALRDRLAGWAPGRYDLVWYGRAENHAALGGVVDGPAIVDLDDLEDHKALARVRAGVGTALGGIVARVNARRWARAQRQVAARVPTVVCSEVDRLRIGGRGHVIPNGFPAPARPVGRERPSDPPVVVFHGNLIRSPNADGAAFLVREVLPLLRRRIPGVRVRLAGRAGEAVRRLAAPPEVTVTGEVPDMAQELSLADVAVCTVRYGGGTRIKILECLAHRLPVVSTTVGSEGLDVTSGDHLMIADRPETIADAVARLVEDLGVRERLMTEGRRLFDERYEARRIEGAVAALAESVGSGELVA